MDALAHKSDQSFSSIISILNELRSSHAAPAPQFTTPAPSSVFASPAPRAEANSSSTSSSTSSSDPSAVGMVSGSSNSGGAAHSIYIYNTK